MSYNTLITQQNREEEVYYEMIGSYQGDWVLFTYKDGKFLFRDGGFGSCTGCDAYEAEFYWDEKAIIDSQKVIDFVNNYPPKGNFTQKKLRAYFSKHKLFHGFIPFDTKAWHEEDFDEAISKGLEACLKYIPKEKSNDNP